MNDEIFIISETNLRRIKRYVIASGPWRDTICSYNVHTWSTVSFILFLSHFSFKTNFIRHTTKYLQQKTVFNPSFSSQFPAWVILFIYENDGAIPFLYPICTRYENGLLCYFMNSPSIFCMGNGNGCKSHVTLSFKNSYIYIIKMGSTRITHS